MLTGMWEGGARGVQEGSGTMMPMIELPLCGIRDMTSFMTNRRIPRTRRGCNRKRRVDTEPTPASADRPS